MSSNATVPHESFGLRWAWIDKRCQIRPARTAEQRGPVSGCGSDALAYDLGVELVKEYERAG